VSGPGLLQRLADKAAVAWTHGVRIRLYLDGTRLKGTTLGRTPGPPPERILRILLELEPRGEGTVDLVHEERGSWRIRMQGSLADPSLEQRLRNTLASP